MHVDVLDDACRAFEKLGIGYEYEGECIVVSGDKIIAIEPDGMLVVNDEPTHLFHATISADDIVIDVLSHFSDADVHAMLKRFKLASALSQSCTLEVGCADAERLFALGFTDADVCTRILTRDYEYSKAEADRICSEVSAWDELVRCCDVSRAKNV